MTKEKYLLSITAFCAIYSAVMLTFIFLEVDSLGNKFDCEIIEKRTNETTETTSD